jgi:hypothetical protein
MQQICGMEEQPGLVTSLSREEKHALEDLRVEMSGHSEKIFKIILDKYYCFSIVQTKKQAMNGSGR